MNETVTALTWSRTPPDAVGWWLRMNAAGQPSIHQVSVWPDTDDFYIGWGQLGLRSVTDPKLQGWWWYGPIPIPPP